MSDGIFLIQADGALIEMTEQSYDSEALLQRLLADYPSLLAGNQMNHDEPRRWLLVKREAGLPSDDASCNRWSVDHLFLDQEGIPTLIEVKRSSNSQIRREIVGQMLDYAANAVVYWPIEQIQVYLETTCQEKGVDIDQEIIDLLGEDADIDQFWQSVKTNLQAGRVRMVFVADEIPSELRRIVEFLNEQMNPAEVLAVEIKQFVGEGLKTLVPRVMGQTAEAQQKKGFIARTTRKWDESSFFKEIEIQTNTEQTIIARKLFEWSEQNTIRIQWGEGKRNGSFGPVLQHNGENYFIFYLWTSGWVEIAFQWMNRPPFNEVTKRRELLARMNAIQGITLPDDGITRRPNIPLSALTTEGALEHFIDALNWFVAEAKSI